MRGNFDWHVGRPNMFRYRLQGLSHFAYGLPCILILLSNSARATKNDPKCQTVEGVHPL